MKYLLSGIICVVAGAIIMWIIATIKALKDPDVKIASQLGIDIRRYHLYKEIYDKHWDLMQKYGTDSKQANDYFTQRFREVKNPNEWRRYQAYRAQKLQEDIMNMYIQ